MMFRFKDSLKLEDAPRTHPVMRSMPWMDDNAEMETADFKNFRGDIESVKFSSKNLFSGLLDEDSGLGLDEIQEEESVPQANGISEAVEEIGFELEKSIKPKLPIHKRPLFDNDNFSPAGEMKHSTRLPKRLKKSHSFEDTLFEKESKENRLEHVMSLVSRLSEESDVIGDGSKICCLPTVPGDHADLKSVTIDTVAELLDGKFHEEIGSFQLVDCRYPYEYEGGHIKGAINVYKQEDVSKLFQNVDQQRNDGKQHILIFYCEFSSERGPKMYRSVRGYDRMLNAEMYPQLHYPEIYLIQGGYKSFFARYQNLCDPKSYKPMLHKDHSSDLRHFRCKSKSWSGGVKKRRGHKLY